MVLLTPQHALRGAEGMLLAGAAQYAGGREAGGV